ncbi:hypothetical protein HHI36_001552 [Cryptolaemus montrouzieri]|uniref:Serine/threonine-protein kinase greatwall n=1 Tax=Cryptolaemus montrouzieri TaxID=559131 RepID=A0ABD2P8L6_9CUCU
MERKYPPYNNHEVRPKISTMWWKVQKKADNIYYLVTEVVNGGDLCTYVKAQRNGKLDERSTKFFAQQFVSALSYMHQRGIVHSTCLTINYFEC